MGSLTLVTGDTSYVSQTIIDAENLGIVRAVVLSSGEDSTTSLIGLTIQNVQEYGIECINSASVNIDHVDVKNCEQSGISIGTNSYLMANNVKIQDNHGSGLSITDSEFELNNLYGTCHPTSGIG